jgi:hypothetical protein
MPGCCYSLKVKLATKDLSLRIFPCDQAWVPHISLVFREMWDTTSPPLRISTTHHRDPGLGFLRFFLRLPHLHELVINQLADGMQ